MKFHMNGMDKFVAELHGMVKTTEESNKKNPNYVMMVQKEKKKEEALDASQGQRQEKVSDEPSSSKPKTKGKFSSSPN
jgi:hypothetical protein